MMIRVGSTCATVLTALVLALSASEVLAEQFVLFDATFTYTKADADNAKPSKSHYYIKGDRINSDCPRDWTAPIDYRNGTAHIRAEVVEKPPGGAPTTWTICYIPNKGKGNGYGCTGTDLYTKEGVYEKDVSMTKFWENDSIVWSEGIKQVDLVIKDDSGGKGHAHKRADHERYFPTTMRITVVQVSAGAKYDSSLVPNLPARAEDKGEGEKTALAPEGSVQVGQAAPQIVAFTPDGNFDVQSYQRGRAMLLTFWRLGDPAGARQFEVLKKIRRRLADEDHFMIVSVCIGDDQDDAWTPWQHFLEAEGKVTYGDRDRGTFRFLEDHKWINVLQDDSHVSTAHAYGVDRTPEAFLIGPDRTLKAVRIPVDRLEATVTDALKKSP